MNVSTKEIKTAKWLGLTCSMFLASCTGFDFNQRSDFIVAKGEVKTISARTYTVNSFKIEEGGTLRVNPNQRQWLIFDVQGDAVIEGKIEYKNMRPTPGAINAVAPNGTKLTFTHPQASFGGDGGAGYPCGGQPGGNGALGKNEYGGGGGGGATATKLPPRAPGDSANDWRGASRYKRGGDGGKRRESPNGGLIYLSIKGKLVSNTGMVNLSGGQGKNGGQGADGSSARTCGIGPGGGGGGAPGGDGGYLLVHAGLIISEPDFVAAEGQGGAGGLGGAIKWGRAVAGRNGESGDAGYADFLSQN